MLNTLANHNDDIRRLLEKGYAIGMDSNYLVVRDIPYLDNNKQLQWGTIVSKLVFVDTLRVKLEDHQVFFCGSHPHEMNGKPIANLGGGATKLVLISSDLVVQRSFSNRPPNGFADLYDKIESYLNIISGPAMNLYNVNPFTFRSTEEVSDSIFKVRDTLTSRAEIGDLAGSFKNEVLAIIGLGGTGAYLLDMLVKTPVKDIRGFDGDFYHAHTAFRSPGKVQSEGEQKELGIKKAEVYKARYENFRHGLQFYDRYIQADSDEYLEGVTFAFVCVDKGTARNEIIALLNRLKIPFIDVGIGLDRQRGPISGTARTTVFEAGEAGIILEKQWVPLIDVPEDIYRNNIQIAELNALNACFAIIRYKQIRGFYADDANFHHQLFTIDSFHSAYE